MPEATLREFGASTGRFDDTTFGREPYQMTFTVEPTFEGTHLLPNHRIVLDILKTNQWERPIYFAITVGHEHLLGLEPFLRVDGLAQRVTPLENPPLQPEIVKWNLFQLYQYRNTNDPHVSVDETSRALLVNYKGLFFRLAQQYASMNWGENCLMVLNKMEALFPEDRFPDPSPQFSSMVTEMYRRFGAGRKW